MSREGLRKALLSVGAVFPPHLLPLHFLLHVCYERAHAHALKSHLGSWAQLNPCAGIDAARLDATMYFLDRNRDGKIRFHVVSFSPLSSTRTRSCAVIILRFSRYTDLCG